MPTITIPDDVFDRLAMRAASLNTTVEQLITPLLELATADTGSVRATVLPHHSPFDDWKRNFDAWMAEAQTRARRYPAGFVMDDSRESIYEGCGE